jgi:hypothetical protein
MRKSSRSTRALSAWLIWPFTGLVAAAWMAGAGTRRSNHNALDEILAAGLEFVEADE